MNVFCSNPSRKHYLCGALRHFFSNVKRSVFGPPGVVFLLLAALTGCRTGPALPPVSLDEAGWTISRGEALWRHGDKLELAGEVLLAAGLERSLVQFSKGPIEIVSARREGTAWEIQFPAQKRRYSGRGRPPKALPWLHLADAVAGRPLPKGFSWSRSENSWKFESRRDVIEGVFSE